MARTSTIKVMVGRNGKTRVQVEDGDSVRILTPEQWQKERSKAVKEEGKTVSSPKPQRVAGKSKNSKSKGKEDTKITLPTQEEAKTAEGTLPETSPSQDGGENNPKSEESATSKE